MIIACPECATRYAVPDSAIGSDGRTVRCAKCRHSWFQDGPGLAGDGPLPPPPARADSSPPPTAPPPPEPPLPEPPLPDAVAAPQFQAREAAIARATSTNFAATPSSFAHEPPFRPRRNPAKMWMLGAVLFALVSLGAIGAVATFGLPAWVPLSRATFAGGHPDLVLEFPPNRKDRRTLPNGTEFFGASGSVTNIGSQRRAVPTILIVLRDAQQRIVYSWEVIPAKRVLGPGESIPINEAVTDVPKSAVSAEIGWKPE